MDEKKLLYIKTHSTDRIYLQKLIIHIKDLSKSGKVDYFIFFKNESVQPDQLNIDDNEGEETICETITDNEFMPKNSTLNVLDSQIKEYTETITENGVKYAKITLCYRNVWFKFEKTEVPETYDSYISQERNYSEEKRTFKISTQELLDDTSFNIIDTSAIIEDVSSSKQDDSDDKKDDSNSKEDNSSFKAGKECPSGIIEILVKSFIPIKYFFAEWLYISCYILVSVLVIYCFRFQDVKVTKTVKKKANKGKSE